MCGTPYKTGVIISWGIGFGRVFFEKPFD